jgi:hypothetical protein
MRPEEPKRRSISAAALPAAPPLTITTDFGMPACGSSDGRSTTLDLRSHICGPVPLLDVPARHRVQRRRAKRLAGRQAERGVMPGTAHRPIDEQAVGKRSAIVRADGADREHCVSASRAHHRFAVRMPEQHGAVGDARERDSFGQVSSAECVRHSISFKERRIQASSRLPRHEHNGASVGGDGMVITWAVLLEGRVWSR